MKRKHQVKIRYITTRDKTETILGFPREMGIMDERGFLGIRTAEGWTYVPVDRVVSLKTKRPLKKEVLQEWSSDEGLYA